MLYEYITCYQDIVGVADRNLRDISFVADVFLSSSMTDASSVIVI